MFERSISRVNLHIGNSGVCFEFKDCGHGPQIEVRSSAFGNIQNSVEILTTKQSLIKLREALDEAIAFDDYSEDYCHAARYFEPYTMGECQQGTDEGDEECDDDGEDDTLLRAVAQAKVELLEEFKKQILIQNPQITGMGL